MNFRKMICFVVLGTIIFSANAVIADEKMQTDKRGRKAKRHAKRIEHLEKELLLSETQKAEINTIYENSGQEAKTIMTEAKEKIKAIKETADGKIIAVLNPEQQKKYAQMKEKRKKNKSKSKAEKVKRLKDQIRKLEDQDK